jgi:hypothetical protein
MAQPESITTRRVDPANPYPIVLSICRAAPHDKRPIEWREAFDLAEHLKALDLALCLSNGLLAIRLETECVDGDAANLHSRMKAEVLVFQSDVHLEDRLEIFNERVGPLGFYVSRHGRVGPDGRYVGRHGSR